MAHTAAHDRGLIGAILISAADMGRLSDDPRKLVAEMADDMESLSGVTAQSMADELQANGKAFRLVSLHGQRALLLFYRGYW